MIITETLKYDMGSIIENQTGKRISLTNEQTEEMCKVVETMDRAKVIEYCKQLVK